MANQPGFSSPRVDFGIVVSDIAKSAAFYTAIGFKEVEGFDVPAEMGEKSGLTAANKPFSVRIFQLGDGDDATNVKVMQFAGGSPARPDNSTIHAGLGIRYLTLYVDDVDAAIARARKAGVFPLAQGPYKLPAGFPDGVWLACVKDPDGNIIEFVGPKK
ncbi:MAG: VOC family protein [Phycisphaerae bacterium]|nr:VOC family protein [Phycisphaerae bacterium]